LSGAFVDISETLQSANVFASGKIDLTVFPARSSLRPNPMPFSAWHGCFPQRQRVFFLLAILLAILSFLPCVTPTSATSLREMKQPMRLAAAPDMAAASALKTQRITPETSAKKPNVSLRFAGRIRLDDLSSPSTSAVTQSGEARVSAMARDSDDETPDLPDTPANSYAENFVAEDDPGDLDDSSSAFPCMGGDALPCPRFDWRRGWGLPSSHPITPLANAAPPLRPPTIAAFQG